MEHFCTAAFKLTGRLLRIDRFRADRGQSPAPRNIRTPPLWLLPGHLASIDILFAGFVPYLYTPNICTAISPLFQCLQVPTRTRNLLSTKIVGYLDMCFRLKPVRLFALAASKTGQLCFVDVLGHARRYKRSGMLIPFYRAPSFPTPRCF